MANSVDPDQTAPGGPVWSRSALFAYAISSGPLVYKLDFQYSGHSHYLGFQIGMILVIFFFFFYLQVALILTIKFWLSQLNVTLQSERHAAEFLYI